MAPTASSLNNGKRRFAPRSIRSTGAEDLFPHSLRGPTGTQGRGAAAERRVSRAAAVPRYDGMAMGMGMVIFMEIYGRDVGNIGEIPSGKVIWWSILWVIWYILWKSSISSGKTCEWWPFSTAMLKYQSVRVVNVIGTSWGWLFWWADPGIVMGLSLSYVGNIQKAKWTSGNWTIHSNLIHI